MFPQFISASSKVGCHSGCSLPHPNGLHSRFAEMSSSNQALILLTFLAKLLERNSSWQLQCLCSSAFQATAQRNGRAHLSVLLERTAIRTKQAKGRLPASQMGSGRGGQKKQRSYKEDRSMACENSGKLLPHLLLLLEHRRGGNPPFPSAFTSKIWGLDVIILGVGFFFNSFFKTLCLTRHGMELFAPIAVSPGY